MALTSKEQNKLVTLLGYGLKTIQAGSVIYDKVLNDRLNQLTPDGEDLVRCYIDRIYKLEDQMACAPARLAAAAVDGLKMNLDELPMLRAERKKIIRELSVQIDIPYVGTNGPNIGVSV